MGRRKRGLDPWQLPPAHSVEPTGLESPVIRETLTVCLTLHKAISHPHTVCDSGHRLHA
jgi:hypothetical protein